MTTKKPTTKPILEVPEAALRGVVRTNLDHPDPTPEQRARRARTKEAVLALGVPFTDHLPVIEDVRATTLRTPRAIAERVVCVALAAVKAEGLEQQRVLELFEKWNVDALATAEERAYLLDATPTEKDRQKFGWRYECVHVLLWALGLREALLPPDEIVDVGPDVALVRDRRAAGLEADARPRTTTEVLDANDLYYCLHWATVELRLRGEEAERVSGDIVVERHYALNWLIGYRGQEWDRVATDT